jgi:phospholipid transport system transporter-binding protein
MGAAPPTPGRDGAGTTFELLPAAGGRLEARGPLTFATARAARQLGLRALAAAADGQGLQVDCSGVTAADSAGLAVLLDWLGAAKRAGRTLRYTHLPPGLLALARISEVDELLERGV